MLSRSQYRGKLSYEEYSKRYKKHQLALPKADRNLPDDTPSSKPQKDIPPTKEEIKKYREEYVEEIQIDYY